GGGQVFGGLAVLALLAHQHQQVADDVGPAVVDQVLLGEAAGDQGVEVVHPVLLPAGLQALSPRRIGGTVGAHVDGRGRALEDVELLRGRSDVRHALHGRGARADDADALVLQAGEVPVRIAAGVAVIPAA